MLCRFCHHSTNDSFLVDGDVSIFVCSDCQKSTIKTCSCCGKKFFYHEWIPSLGSKIEDTFFCKKCMSTKIIVHKCCDCERLILNDSVRCYSCSTMMFINSYSFKPTPIFHGNTENKNNLFAGIELEINFNKSKDAIRFMEHIGKVHEDSFVYLKHDGSLGKYGIEIVSHPATLAYHCKFGVWEDIFSFLHDTNTDNCGLHFHFGKKSFTDEQVFLLDFLVNNYSYMITQIGSRKLDGYCKQRQNQYDRWGYSRYSEHTDACNLSNDNTIELRFCKSTNNYHSFIKKIKNIFALVYFVKLICDKGLQNKIIKSDKDKVEEFFKNFQGELLSRI